MKILWIVNSVLDCLSKALYKKPSNGVWMDATLSELKEKKEYNIVVATTLKIKEIVKHEEDGVIYYAIPDNYPLLYKENKKSNIIAWKQLLLTENPDLIVVWGTEFTHGLCALRIAKELGIPSVIYMQGLLRTIARFYRAGIPYEELKNTLTFRDIIKRDGILRQQKKYYKAAEKEEEMLRLSGAIISENEWCNAIVRAVVPDIKIYHCPLSINKVFTEYSWNIDNAENFSIISNASGYTIKGLHILLKAIATLKDKYPEIKLYVPGEPPVSDGSFQWFIRKNGYTKYIEMQIKALGIKDNIVWLGRLSQTELAKRYANTHVFVMPSAIENHSRSLKEAMMVGMPCISSYVGGIPEYLNHGENGLLYRFEEYEILAMQIEKIFSDKGLAERLSHNAKKTAFAMHDGTKLSDRMSEIYKQIVK